MGARRTALRLHQWVGLVVGIQLLLWVVGGLVMTAIPIERVRGEHRVAERPPAALVPGEYVDAAAAARAAGLPAVAEARLRALPRGVAWVLSSADGVAVVDARTGRRLAPLTRAEALALAAAAYAGPGSAVAATFHAAAPAETGREGPLWAVDFDDPERTRFYLSPDTGEVATRRSALWRVYDFFWRLHVMDYDDGESFNHPLVIGASALALVVAVSGLVLLVSWLRRLRAAPASQGVA